MRVGGWAAFLIEGPLRKLPNKPTNIRRSYCYNGFNGRFDQVAKMDSDCGQFIFSVARREFGDQL